MMWNSWGNMWGGGFGFGWILMLVFWGLVIWGIIALVRGAGGHDCCGHGDHKEHGEKTALDILKERYAKGEISKENFETMKKTLIVSFLLLFGLVIQTQAVSTNSNQENQNRNTIQTQEQNQATNQGENNQIRTQEQNMIQTRDMENDNKNDNDKGKSTATQRRSQVANAVQTMLQLADRNGGIGQQVRVVAQNQNQNQVKLEQNIERIQNRSRFAKFFVGPNYGEIKDAQKTLEQNREQIRQLNQVRNQLSNQGDQQQLAEQVRVLEQANQEIEVLINDAQEGFALFGWLNKLIS